MEGKLAPTSPDRRVAALAARQHGVVGLVQLHDLGLPQGALEHRLRAGRLHRVHRGVYAVGHASLGEHGRWLAAVLACGEGAALSHRAAAALWGLRQATSVRAELSVPGRAGRRAPTGVVLHRPVALPADEVTRRAAIPVTTPARTLVDLGAVLSRGALEDAVNRVEQLRLFDLVTVQVVLDRRPHRPGARALAAVLDRWAEPAFTRSKLERRFLALCSDLGLPKPAVNTSVGGYEVDFHWPCAGLIVETDGREGHGTHAAFEGDRARDAHLSVLGYRVVRFTYRQVAYDPERVALVLTSLLRDSQPPRPISSIR